MAPSRPRRLDVEASLLRIVIGYRIVGAGWMAILVAITLLGSSPVERPGVVVGALVLVIGWTTAVVIVSFRRPAALRTLVFVIADVIVAVVSLVAPIVAGTGGFSGGYPLAAVFHGVYAAGWLGGWITAAALTAFSVWRVTTGQFSDLTAASATLLSFVFTALATAWAIETMRGREQLRVEAEEALAVEQAERLRAEERAALAARIHDGVLQTLALIQRDHDDGVKVAALARRQERELREVLYGTGGSGDGGFRAAVTRACADIEELAGVPVQTVLVGDRDPDETVAAVALATREAVLNAAKHSGADQVSVYGEADDGGLAVFVRDRGRGFEPDAVAPDRRGIADSICARLESVGGSATIVSAPGAGTEVRLEVGSPS